MNKTLKTLLLATINVLLIFAIVFSASLLISKFLPKNKLNKINPNGVFFHLKCQNFDKKSEKLLTILQVFNNKNGKVAFSASNNSVFAKAKANCFLFLTPDILNQSTNNILFTVPESYFVQILEEYSSTVFKVSYNGKIGYVSKYLITKVSFTPALPEPESIEITCGNISTHLRSHPDSSSDVVTILSAGVKLKYVASCFGEQPNGESSSTWFFVQYTPSSNPTMFFEGYVFAERTSSLPSVPTNTEADPVEEIDDILSGEKTNSKAHGPISKALMIGLILIMCLPAFVFGVYILSNAKRIKHQNQL